MKDIIVKINRNDSKAYLNDNELGVRGENLQGYLMLELTEMINGVGILEIEKEDGTKGYLVMEQYDKGYKLQIKSSLLADTGIIYMNLRITEDGSLETPPVFKSRKFFLRVLETIDATTEIPDEYPEWIDIANAKILEMDEALAQVDNLDIEVSKVDHTATVTVTKKDGSTESVQIYDGEGSAGTTDYEELENKPKINSVELKGNKSSSDLGLQPSGDYALRSEIPDVSNFITKEVNNLTYYTLKTSTGSLIDLEINGTTYVVTLMLKDIDGNVISTDTIDLPLESVVVSGSFDSVNKKIVLTLQNGNTVDIPVGDLIAGLQTEITSSNKLASDLVDDSNSGHKFATTSEKTAWNAKYDKPAGGIPKTDMSSDVQTSLGKADTALQEHQDISGKEDKSNKVTSIGSSSTDTQYPSAKAVYDNIINKIDEQDAVSMFGNAVYGEISTPSKEFSIHTAFSYFGRKLPQDKLENDLQLLGESTQDTSIIYYKCDGTESGDYYFAYNSVNYQFTMPTVASGDIIEFNTNSLVLSLNGTTISTTEASTGTLITMANTPSSDFPINIDNVKAYNKFDKVAATLNNTRYTLNADGTITNSTYWGGDGRNYFNAIFLKAGTYTLSYIPSLSDNGVERFSIKNITTDTDIENTSFGITNGQRYNYTFTLSTDSNIGICIMANQQADGVMTLREIQINEGAKVKPYRPYGCVGIYITGGNLLTTSRNISTTGNRTINISLPAGNYIFSWSNWVSSGANSMSRIDLIYTDDTTNELTVYKTYYSKSANATKPVKAIRIYSNTTEGNSRTITLTYSDFMLQPGTAPTLPYRPYVENHIYIPITHDMNGIDTVRDKIYWNNGIWYDLKANGELTASGTTVTISDAKSNGKYMSTHKAAGNLSGTDLTFDSEVTNAEIIYELATPVVTQITDEDTINALETIRTYTGLTVFTSDIDLTGSYVQDLSNGYDATKTQYLKNVNGILQWV